MSKTPTRTLATTFAALIVLAIHGNASAYPTRGGSCSSCHTRAGGALTITPNPLNIQLAASGLLTFKVTSMNGSDEAAISVQGLENPLLAASIGRGSSAWTHRVNSTYGQSYVSNTFSSAASFLLNLVIGAGATPGTYPITVMFANGNMGCTTTNFSLKVAPSVPEPVCLGLMPSGLLAVALQRKRRR